MESRTHDVIIVGASAAGCAAAIMYARAGLHVALFERRKNIDASKNFCTHFIQSSAKPTLNRLGLTQALEEEGAVRNSVRMWTRWGWIHESEKRQVDEAASGYSIRRKRLDPILREAALSTPGVEAWLGCPVKALLRKAGRITGVRADECGVLVEARAPLVVGADGMNSRVAQLAEVDTKVYPNNRIGYFSYYRGVAMKTGTESQMWFLDPDCAYAFPNEDDITVLAWLPTRDSPLHLGERPDHDLRQVFSRLPDAPDLSAAQPLGKPIVAKRLVSHHCTPLEDGVALIGDAGMVSDPLWGSGLSFAFQSAEWLVDATCVALEKGLDPMPGVMAYRQHHGDCLNGYEQHMVDYSQGRRFKLLERLFYAAATRDPVVADSLLAYGARNITKRELFTPDLFFRILRASIGAPTVSRDLMNGITSRRP